MAVDPELRKHQEWLGYLQPVGVTVSPAALVAAQAHVNANVVREQQAFQAMLKEIEGSLYVKDLQELCCGLLGWSKDDFAPGNSEDLSVSLLEYGERLTPTFAVRDPDDEKKWLLFIQALPDGAAFDKAETEEKDGWHASPQARFERLLREKSVPTGLITNGTAIRLVYAPHGESSGHLTFPVQAMSEVAGRPTFAAFLLLFSADRLFTLPPDRRLLHILDESRKYQSQVSTELAEQVLAALYELLRGFRSADWEANRQLLGHLSPEAREEVYGGLLTTLMRLVFLLYAEERGLLPTESRTYVDYYSVGRLYGRLREDHERHPDTMDQRFGAWAQLLTLFRLVHDGASHGALSLPPRHGKLFDPDTYPFLEGRPRGNKRAEGQRLTPPKVSDGVVYRVLENLLILDGERISYRALDVEQIGSVYEAMMGFTLGIANGDVVALKPDHVVIELEDLLQRPGNERARYLKDLAACDVTGAGIETLKAARTHIELLEALGRRLSPHTQRPLQPGSLYLQPTDERRRSGSHYTPRSLTEPIVRTTLKPILDDLGPNPSPEQILELKVCDPAMGSGAFLVEACRLLAERLVASWVAHKSLPKLPPDEEPVVHARRLVAQQCLYGVDKNPFAVDLAKLSLWLATLAKDHPFTYLDHALRQGDSLVGLTREQIASFHWEPQTQIPLIRQRIDEALKRADDGRARIRAMAASDDTDEKARLLADVDTAVEQVRLIGDAVIAAFFGATKDQGRRVARDKHMGTVESVLSGGSGIDGLKTIVCDLRLAETPVPPFHWQIEFPEVFHSGEGGFHAIVGNPPFAGKNTTIEAHAHGYPEWLKAVHEESHGNADLVAHFYRRSFQLLRVGGAFGLIATKTIGQGDTRSTGLRWICTHGGSIYEARRRIKWPGVAAVVVSIVHLKKGQISPPFLLDGLPVPRITAYLFTGGTHEDPARSCSNARKCFQGSILLGLGFSFDDTDTTGAASSLAEMQRLIKRCPRNQERIFPFIGGEEVATSPSHIHHRYVIDFFDRSLEEAGQWPDLLDIVRRKVKPERDGQKRDANRERWWQYAEKRPGLYEAVRGLKQVLVCVLYSPHMLFTFLKNRCVYSNKLGVFSFDGYGAFSVLQCRVHEVWARAFSSTLKNDLQYTPTDCFETFPLPSAFETSTPLERVGRDYYEHRAKLMADNDEGLTKTYNRFHDPEERSEGILRLRDLHAALDHAVLDAYGWRDLNPSLDFIVDFEEDEEQVSKRRRSWRYRWPDDFRDEVLARLLALNKERAEQEKLAGAAASLKPEVRSARARLKPKESPGQRNLF